MDSVDCHIPDEKSSPYEGGLEPLLLFLFYLIISITDNRPSQASNKVLRKLKL